MKNDLSIKIVSISLFVSMALLQGCNKQEVIDVRQTEVTQGLLYKLYEKEPFTGKVYNISGDYLAKNMLPSTNFHISLFPPYTYYVHAINENANCNVEFKKGVIDGEVLCTLGDEIIYTGLFKNGLKEGEEIFRLTITKQVAYLNSGMDSESVNISALYQSNWQNNIRNGKEELYTFPDKKPMALVFWENNKKDGIEKRWLHNGELLGTELNWQNGYLVEGYETIIINNLEGKSVYKDRKLINNISKLFTDNKRNMLRQITTTDPINQVIKKEFFKEGQLIEKEEYKKGQLIDRINYQKNTSLTSEQQTQNKDDEDYIPSDEFPFKVTQVIHGETLDIVVRALSTESVTAFSVNDKNCQLISSSSQPLSMEKEFILEQGQTMIFTYRSAHCNANLATIDTVGDSWGIPIVKQ